MSASQREWLCCLGDTTERSRQSPTGLCLPASQSMLGITHEHINTQELRERENKSIISSAVIRSRECKHIGWEKQRVHVRMALNMFFPLWCICLSLSHIQDSDIICHTLLEIFSNEPFNQTKLIANELRCNFYYYMDINAWLLFFDNKT